jgi:hypothetical protein
MGPKVAKPMTVLAWATGRLAIGLVNTESGYHLFCYDNLRGYVGHPFTPAASIRSHALSICRQSSFAVAGSQRIFRQTLEQMSQWNPQVRSPTRLRQQDGFFFTENLKS